MNVLRSLMWFAAATSILGMGVFIWLALVVFKLVWFLVTGQILIIYILAEILHSMYKKRKLPHPSSMAFQKIMSRYKI